MYVMSFAITDICLTGLFLCQRFILVLLKVTAGNNSTDASEDKTKRIYFLFSKMCLHLNLMSPALNPRLVFSLFLYSQFHFTAHKHTYILNKTVSYLGFN